MSFEVYGIIEDHPLKSGGWELLRSVSVRSPLLAGASFALPGGRAVLHDEPGAGVMHLHAGYRCDGPSIPAMVPSWIIDGDDEKLAGPAWVHDGGYDGCRSGQIHDWRAFRASVDLLFYEMMLANGVPGWRARIAYWAVRWRGEDAARPQPDVEGPVRVLP